MTLSRNYPKSYIKDEYDVIAKYSESREFVIGMKRTVELHKHRMSHVPSVYPEMYTPRLYLCSMLEATES
jgi:hypothetical protein